MRKTWRHPVSANQSASAAIRPHAYGRQDAVTWHLFIDAYGLIAMQGAITVVQEAC